MMCARMLLAVVIVFTASNRIPVIETDAMIDAAVMQIEMIDDAVLGSDRDQDVIVKVNRLLHDAEVHLNEAKRLLEQSK